MSDLSRRRRWSTGFLTLLLVLVALRTPRATSGITLLFAGDVMLGRGVAAALDGDWAATFADVHPWLTGADLVCANLESPLTDAPFAGGRFDLRAPPVAVQALTSAGFDLVSLANNHALDGGPAGLAETLAELAGVGIVPLVDPEIAHRVGEGTEPLQIIDRDGLRLAFVGFLDDPLANDPPDSGLVLQAAAEADLVVVQIHWGAEYYPLVTARQRGLAEELAAAGADLIIGHGPHVLQPLEWVDGALVAFSLGNLLFDQPFPDTRQGAFLRVTFAGGRLAAVEALPTLIVQGRVRRAAGAEAVVILER